jgi:hypothetical protein
MVKLETYARCEPFSSYENPEDFYDDYLTAFLISKKNLKTVLKELEWRYKEFMEEWTWDMAEHVYNIASEKGYVKREWLIESCI